MANEFRIKKGLIVERLIYPNIDGTAGQVVKTDGSNTLTFGDVAASEVTGLANVATSGDYADLINLPTLVENFTDLADVNLVAPATGAIVKFNGSQWVVGPDLGLVEQIDSANTLLTVTDPNGPITTLTVNEANIDISNTTGTIPKTRVSGLVEAFVDLSDTPSDYTGDSLKYVRVNVGETALEFNPLADVAESGDYNDLLNLPTLSIVSGTGDFNDLLNIPASVNVDTFLELLDVPNSYVGQAGMVLLVNPAENGVTFDDVNNFVSIALDDLTDVDTSGAINGSVIKFNSGTSTWVIGTDDTGTDIQNLFETFAADTGSTTANSATDTLTITGGTNVTTTIVGDTLTIDAAAGSVNEINDIGDVDTTGVVDGSILVFDNGTSTWIIGTNSPVTGGIDDLDDVDTTTNAAVRGDILTFDGTNWIPGRSNEWVKITYTIAGTFDSETHSDGISNVSILTTDANNTTIDVTFTDAKGFPPQSIIEYGYIYNQNEYIRQELTATLDYFIRPGGTSGSPSPDPFGAFGDGMEMGTFKVDRNEAGAVNGGSFPSFIATHSYLVFGF